MDYSNVASGKYASELVVKEFVTWRGIKGEGAVYEEVNGFLPATLGTKRILLPIHFRTIISDAAGEGRTLVSATEVRTVKLNVPIDDSLFHELD